MKTIVEYVLQSKAISLISEYLISKKKNKVSSQKFNIDMTSDDVLMILDGYHVTKLHVGHYYTTNPKENEIIVMTTKNAFDGKDMKFMIKQDVYTFSFNYKDKITYVLLEDPYSCLSKKDEIMKTLDKINKNLNL